jgi:hypothetical protein
MLMLCLALSQDWQEAARKIGFREEEIRALGKDRVLVTAESWRQVFDPYVSSSLPPFVTSDSLLNAFHVLLEESIAQVETTNARRLPDELRKLWTSLAKAPAGPGLERARILLGTALGLLGEKVEDERTLAEIERVTRAEGTGKPAWLGPPDPGFTAIDYARFRPRGLYDRNDVLRRYFRAVSWLQAVPFRLDRDDELTALLLLAEASSPLVEGLGGFLGARDDWDLNRAREDLGDGKPLDLPAFRKRVRIDEDKPRINDLLRFPGSEPAYRVISARRTPDGVLFEKTTQPLNRPFPSGLEVAAALGSSFARGALDGPPALLEAVDACKPLFRDETLYAEYLGCLAALVDAPEPDAPALFAGRPWAIKSCQTVLAGWAQLRHAWMLQAKRGEYYLGMSLNSHGFVEPEPEFFARMHRLAARVRRWLDVADAFKPEPRDAADEIRALITVLEKGGFAVKGEEAENTMEAADYRLLRAGEAYIIAFYAPGVKTWSAEHYVTVIRELKASMPVLERGELPSHEGLASIIRGRRGHLDPLWRRLAELSLRLEALAHKQLRGAAFTEAEGKFLKDYGAELAGIMLYGGNSYLSPNDDAPRVADVHGALGKSLLAGIGRPRALYVLYPWKGQDILCRGAVLPYYEELLETRLTDVEWKARLDATPPPARPAWMKPLETSTLTGLKKEE